MELKKAAPAKKVNGYSLLSSEDIQNSDCKVNLTDCKNIKYFSKINSANNQKILKKKEIFKKIKAILNPLIICLIFLIIMILTYYIKNNFDDFYHIIIGKRINLGIFIERLKGDKISKEAVLITNGLTEYFNVCLLTGPKENNEYILNENIKRIEVYSDDVMLAESVELAVENCGIDIFLINRIDNNQINFLDSLGKKIVIIFHDFFINYLKQSKNICGLNSLEKADLLLNFYPENLYLWNKKGLQNDIYIPKMIPNTTTEVKISNLETRNILLIGNKNQNISIYNFKHAINIMKMVKINIPDVLLQILYYNENITEIKNLVNEYNLENNVKFYKKANPENFYRNASIFLQFTNKINDDLENSLIQPKLHQLPIIIIGKKYLVSKENEILSYDFSEIEETRYLIINLFNRKYYRTLIGQGTMLSPQVLKNNKKAIIKKWSRTIEKVLNEPKYLKHFISDEKDKFDIKNFEEAINEELATQKPLGISNFSDLLETLNKNINCGIKKKNQKKMLHITKKKRKKNGRK